MDNFASDNPIHTLEALRLERTRQDGKLAEAKLRLSALGLAPVSIPRHALEAINAACLVRVSPLNGPAIRG